MPALTVHIEAGPLKAGALPWPDGGSIGRDAANALAIPDQGISRRHARILRDGEAWILEDLDSRNGTFVNDQAVKRHVLIDGDRIQIGRTVLRCVFGPEAAAAPEPAVTQVISRQSLDLLRSGPDAPGPVARVNERLLRLLGFAQTAASAPGLDALWAMTGDALKEALGADRALVLRPLGRDGVWEPHRPPGEGLPGALARIPPSTSVIDTVRRRGDSVLCEAPRSDPRFRGSRSLAAASVASVLCVPVRHEDRLLGALYADRLGEAPPFAPADLELAIGFALALAGPWAQAGAAATLAAGRDALAREDEARHDLVGRSAAIRGIRAVIDRAAASDAAVLVTGESGVGKELVARAVHRQSARSRGPFEAVNCAALTESLFESELFGHAKGAFTGAHEDKPGRFELADRGTLFLDEVGDLPESCQTKLLRILEDGRIRRVGDTRDRPVDVRVVAATNRTLEGPGARFRQDLFYRLNVLRIEVPPLRERPEDIPVLAAHYVARFAAASRKPPRTLSPEALAVLGSYPWPGNVRELRNCLERMVVLSDAAVLGPGDIPTDIREAGGRAAGARALGNEAVLVPLESVEKAHLARVLAALDGNKKRTAEVLGIDRGTLYAKMKRYGIEG